MLSNKNKLLTEKIENTSRKKIDVASLKIDDKDISETQKNPKKFVDYLKKKVGYPQAFYNAVKAYPGTTLGANGVSLNDFNKKYKKKYIYDHEDKDIVLNSEARHLFDNSFQYISQFQGNLLKAGFDSLIYGGAALKIFSLIANIRDEENIFKTKDYDLTVYFESKRLTNRIILTNTLKIIDALLMWPENPNFGFLEFYILLDYKSEAGMNDVFTVLMSYGFELHLYAPKINREDAKKNMYSFKFIKLINKEFCIRIKLRFTDMERLIKESIYSYMKITYYYIKKVGEEFKVVNKFIPIELLIKNKKVDGMSRDVLLYHKFRLYVNREEVLLYNLMHLFYKYNHDTKNATIEMKKKEKKDVRDKKRLDLFFRIYCKLILKLVDEGEVRRRLELLKASEMDFKKSIGETLDTGVEMKNVIAYSWKEKGSKKK